MALFKQKTLWLGIVAVLIVLMVFGVAMMGSIVGAKPKDLPIALVVVDQPAKLPSGETLSIGEMVREKLLSNAQLPVNWNIVGSEEKVREGLNEQEYYGALVLPADLSAAFCRYSLRPLSRVLSRSLSMREEHTSGDGC
jgi:YhgE/Pip-like protein